MTIRRLPAAPRALSLLALALSACAPHDPSGLAPAATPTTAPAPLDPTRDYHSYANTADFHTRHLSLDLRADFVGKRLVGTVTLDLERRRPEATEIILDSRDLDIAGVEVATANGAFAATTFTVGTRDPILGSPVSITLPPPATRVRVRYATRPQASGLQWLDAAQTTSGKPFLYTHAQAIHTRSFLPVQDTPRVRLTYDAVIRTDPELVAVMGAEFDVDAPRTGEFHFHMPQPIPAYLIGLAIGRLEYRALGARTGVWAEPALIEAAAHEFADTEAMLARAEELYGPYRWGRYELLILPPSFPWGGMENPRLTFASPTVIAGDRSLVSIVAHELAHAWSGNLVTNATWRDTWLNEGFTVYLENRIMEAVYGAERARMEQVIGLADLREDLAGFPAADRALGALTPDLRGRDPDDGFSKVPYEKGALFLRQLEYRYGRERFDAFLRGWFERHALTSVATEDFLTDLDTELLRADPGKVDGDFLRRWIAGTDVPSDAVLPHSDAMARVDAVRDTWQRDHDLDALAAGAARWTVAEWQHFIDGLPRDLGIGAMQELDARFALTNSTNNEIAHNWFKLVIATRYAGADAALERYLTGIGRRRLVVPLYKELAKTPEGLAFARRVYAQARPFYQAVARTSVEEALTPKVD